MKHSNGHPEQRRRKRGACDLRSNRGVAMMQFVIVFPLLIMFIFGIVDFARFFTLQSVLNKGAEDGARAAATMSNLDIDLRNLSTVDDDYVQYNEARRRVLEAAQVYPLQTLVSDIDTPSPSKLIPFYMTDSMLNLGTGQSAPIIRSGAALIRPGERVEFGENTPYIWVENQLYSPGPGGALPPQNMATLMKEFPVEVHVRATLDLIIPFGQVTVLGSSIAWHGRVPRGPFGNIMGSSTTTSTSTTSTTQTSTTTTSTTTTTMCVINSGAWNDAILTTGGFGQQLGKCPDPEGPPYGGEGRCWATTQGCTMDGL